MNSFLVYWCGRLSEPKFSKGSATIFTFLVFQSNFLHPRWTSFIWISIFSKPKNNYLQSILLLPAGGPTPYLTYFVCNPGQIMLMKIQTKMGTWKIYICVPVYRPEFCSSKLRRKEIKHYQKRTLRSHQVKGCNANPDYGLPPVSSTGVRRKDLHLRYSVVLAVHGFRQRGLEKSLELISCTWPAHIRSHPNFRGRKPKFWWMQHTIILIHPWQLTEVNKSSRPVMFSIW